MPTTRAIKAIKRKNQNIPLDKDIIHYMANLYTINQANPHAESHSKGPTPTDYVLKNPDSWKRAGLTAEGTPKKDRSRRQEALEAVCVPNAEIELRDWLKLKLSKTAWENDGNYRDIIPRSVLAILVEGDPEKISIANDFLKSIDPYTARNQHQPKQNTNQPEAPILSWYILRYPYFLGLYITQTILLMVQYVPGYNMLKDVFNAFTVGFHDADVDDFTTSMFTRLVCMYKDNEEVLQDETKQYMLEHLLKFEGTEYRDTIPNTGAFKFFASLAGYPVTEKGIQNTENHLLMINGSAYLKNQLMGTPSNKGSELENKLCLHLDILFKEGLSEFNSIPYAGYTIDALLNLHDFAEEPVKSRATRVLDKIFYDYAIHSTHDGKSFRPIARQIKKLGNQAFIKDDAARAYMMMWLGKDCHYYRAKDTSRNAMFAFSAAITTYRPPQAVCDLATGKTQGYLAVTGLAHGNAEVSYKNNYQIPTETNAATQKQYILSGGGVSLGRGGAYKIAYDIVTTPDYVINRNAWFNTNPHSRANASIRVQRTAAEVISRNPVLILDGENQGCELKDSFYLGSDAAIQPKAGPGVDSKGKNNSGIYFDTLVGPYPVHIPDSFKNSGIKPTHQNECTQNWALYSINDGLRIAVFDGEALVNQEKKQVGIIMVIPGGCHDCQALIDTIARENQTNVGHMIKFPDACDSVMKGKKVHFEPYAPLDRYAITGVDDTHWPIEQRMFLSVQNKDPQQLDSPGWSTRSVVQNTPDENPIDHLNYQIDEEKSFDFLTVKPHDENRLSHSS